MLKCQLFASPWVLEKKLTHLPKAAVLELWKMRVVEHFHTQKGHVCANATENREMSSFELTM